MLDLILVDYLPLMERTISSVMEEEKIRRELAKKNYLNIHQRRGKRWNS